jgi:integrase
MSYLTRFLKEMYTSVCQTEEHDHEGPWPCCAIFLHLDHLSSWFENKRHKVVPGTLRAQITTLKKYISFLQTVDWVTKSGHLSASLTGCLTRITYYSKIVTKLTKRRRHQKRLQDHANLLTVEDLKQLESSQHVQSTLRNLRSLSPAHCTLKTAIECRNVILCKLLLRSGQRSGALCNLTIGEFRKATPCQQPQGNTWRVLSVENHKTFDTYGYARIPIDSSLYQAMEIYTARLRPLLKNFRHDVHNLEDAPFFLTQASGPMKSGYVSRAISACAMKTPLGFRFKTITTFRKSLVTLIHRQLPDLRGRLATQMSHRLSTGKFTYRLRSNIKAEGKIFLMLTFFFTFFPSS